MITLSISNYNRTDWVIRSFINVINDDRISEIIICDDFSEIGNFEKLSQLINQLNSKKISLYRNDSNQGAFLNKKKMYFTIKKWLGNFIRFW